MSHKQALIKGVYYVEVSGSDGKKVIWKVVYDNVVEDPNKNDDIWLRGFDFNSFDADAGGR